MVAVVNSIFVIRFYMVQGLCSLKVNTLLKVNESFNVGIYILNSMQSESNQVMHCK